jgi:hypothetical protein
MALSRADLPLIVDAIRELIRVLDNLNPGEAAVILNPRHRVLASLMPSGFNCTPGSCADIDDSQIGRALRVSLSDLRDWLLDPFWDYFRDRDRSIVRLENLAEDLAAASGRNRPPQPAGGADTKADKSKKVGRKSVPRDRALLIRLRAAVRKGKKEELSVEESLTQHAKADLNGRSAASLARYLRRYGLEKGQRK